MPAPLILAWCDDLFLQGHQLSTWITDYVDVEESLAVGSIAQDHLAHCAALLGLCGFNHLDRDWHIYQRPSNQWFPSQLSLLPRKDWPATVARQFLSNRATLLLRRYLQLPDQPRVQQLTDVITAEQDIHAEHWERWLRVFASRPELADELSERLVVAVGEAADLFAVPEGSSGRDDFFVDGGSATMHRQWAADVGSVLERCGLPLPPLPTEIRPRASGDTLPRLGEILAEVRHSRGPGGDRQYEVYP